MNTETFLNQSQINTEQLPPQLQAAILNLASIERQYNEMTDSNTKELIAELLLKSDDAVLRQLQQWYEKNKQPVKPTGNQPKYYYINLDFITLPQPKDAMEHFNNSLFVIRGYPVRFKRSEKDYEGNSLSKLNNKFFVAKIDNEFLETNGITKHEFMAQRKHALVFNTWIVANIETGFWLEYAYSKSEKKYYKTKKSANERVWFRNVNYVLKKIATESLRPNFYRLLNLTFNEELRRRNKISSLPNMYYSPILYETRYLATTN